MSRFLLVVGVVLWSVVACADDGDITAPSFDTGTMIVQCVDGFGPIDIELQRPIDPERRNSEFIYIQCGRILEIVEADDE